MLPRFYPILDTGLLARRGIPVIDAAREILDAGAKILQFRRKDFFSREVFADCEQIAELCRRAGARFLINDRADIAALLGAGLHLGQEDLTPSQARRVVPHAFIGYSTHNESQLRAALQQPADYFAVGPVFLTASKDHPDPVLGLQELARLRTITSRPLVAIGGITRANVARVMIAGADSVAVIGDLFAEGRVGDRVKEFLLAVNERE